MRQIPLAIAMFAVLAGAAWPRSATAQPVPADPPAQAQPDPACPPETRNSPTTGSANAPDLSDKLASSKGVICPPGGVDPEMHVPPPAGGDIKVVPPPGSPGGDQSVQPK